MQFQERRHRREDFAVPAAGGTVLLGKAGEFDLRESTLAIYDRPEKARPAAASNSECWRRRRHASIRLGAQRELFRSEDPRRERPAAAATCPWEQSERPAPLCRRTCAPR